MIITSAIILSIFWFHIKQLSLIKQFLDDLQHDAMNIQIHLRRFRGMGDLRSRSVKTEQGSILRACVRKALREGESVDRSLKKVVYWISFCSRQVMRVQSFLWMVLTRVFLIIAIVLVLRISMLKTQALGQIFFWTSFDDLAVQLVIIGSTFCFFIWLETVLGKHIKMGPIANLITALMEIYISDQRESSVAHGGTTKIKMLWHQELRSGVSNRDMREREVLEHFLEWKTLVLQGFKHVREKLPIFELINGICAVGLVLVIG